jgi:hypothetical protein
MPQYDYIMSKAFQVSTSSTMGHGGGTIKRQKICTLLLILCMAVSIFPLAVGASDQTASSNNANIGLKENKNVLEVNAASKVKVKVWYKHWYKSKYKHWYKSHGVWRYTWKYTRKYTWKYYWKYKTTKVKAASSTSTSYKSGSTADTFSDPKLNSIMKSAANYGYSSGVSTAAGLVKHHAGDCWAYSAYLDGKFKAAGYKSRVIQYATSYSSRHRSVQLYQNGGWKTVPYRAYGYNYLIV